MEILCSSCNKKFLIPEEKIPPNIKRFGVKCPHCKNKIIAEVDIKKSASVIKKKTKSTDFYTVAPDNFPPGAKTAFLYVFDEEWKYRTYEFLKRKGYYISEANKEEIGVQKLSINEYDFVLIEHKDADSLLAEVSSWPGNERREVNVILLGDKAKSFDLMVAFLYGVNSYISIEERDRIEDLLDEAIKRYKSFIDLWNTAKNIVKEKGL